VPRVGWGGVEDGASSRLEHARQHLQALVAAQQPSSERDLWPAARALLDDLRDIDELGKVTAGSDAWRTARSSSTAGRTFAALCWVREVALGNRADLRTLPWVRSSELVDLGDGTWLPLKASGAMDGGPQSPTVHVDALLWPELADLPDGPGQPRHRDEWYDEFVAMRGLGEPIRVAVEWAADALARTHG
jgi:hypothetical protein